jgi:hypothetical protein
MALFGRDKDEEYEDEDEFDEEENVRGDRKFTKKFRDLNPGNKRKRKEPPKPWGKKERMVVLVILLATAIISAILALGSGHGSGIHLGLPKIDLNSLNIFKQETIIIRKE